MKKKSSRICGRKTSTPPTPAMTPSTSRLASSPAGSAPRTASPSAPKPVSIKSIGSAAHEKIVWKTTSIRSRKTSGPKSLCVSIESIRSVAPGRLSPRLTPRTDFAATPSIHL